jgi:hypothetical protein
LARSVTLLQLRTDARLYADERPGGTSTFITDTEANRLVNLALTELYDLLVEARGHEYYETVSTSTSTVAGTAAVSLPADFYQLLGVHLQWAANDLEEVRDLEHIQDRHGLVNLGSWSQYGPKAFRLRGTSLEFFPTPTSVVTVALRYVPAFGDLASDAATFDGVNGWEKLVALRAAIEMRVIGGRPYGDLERLYDRERDRVQGLASDRAAQSPKRIRDVQPESNWGTSWPYHGRATS